MEIDFTLFTFLNTLKSSRWFWFIRMLTLVVISDTVLIQTVLLLIYVFIFTYILVQSAHRKALDILNTVGISNSVLKLIERRNRVDQWIKYAGMLLTVIFLFAFVLWRHWPRQTLKYCNVSWFVWKAYSNISWGKRNCVPFNSMQKVRYKSCLSLILQPFGLEAYALGYY